MKGFKNFLAIASLSAMALSTHAGEGLQFNNSRLIVKLKKDQFLPKSQLITSARKLFGRVYVIQTNNAKALEQELGSLQRFEYIEKDYFRSTQKLEEPTPSFEDYSKEFTEFSFNDPKLNKQWSFLDASRYGISVTKAYNEARTQPREKIIVAVVDTGVDYNHEDLKEVMWSNPGEIPGNGIDDDGDGFIDDVHGINTLVRDAQGKPTVDMMDAHSHGTHVSGIIGAKQNNGIGIAGIASNVEIMGIRTVPNSSDELDVDVVEAFLYAAKHGAKIINCSFGKAHNEGGLAVRDAIEHIGKEYGVLVVAAAGNDSSDIDSRAAYPASYDNENLLVVASTSSFGGLSFFSNYGAVGVDLAAPGSSIYSTTPHDGYANMSGTSMASPTTAGVAAHVLSHFPELGPVELKKVLMDSTVQVRSFAGKMVSGGRIDLAQALEKAALAVANRP